MFCDGIEIYLAQGFNGRVRKLEEQLSIHKDA